MKANQPGLLSAAQALTAAVDPAQAATSGPSGGHDRFERRSAVVVDAHGINFPGLCAVARVETWRASAAGPEVRTVRWYGLSRPLRAQEMLEVAAAHWTMRTSCTGFWM